MIPISLLDLSPIVQGGDAAAALRNTVDLAGHAEEWGYRRYWLAEHHNMPGIASAATSIVYRQCRWGNKPDSGGRGRHNVAQPYAFASHFAPEQLEPAIAMYRQRFQPSRHLAKPYVMLGIGVFAAETGAEAKRLFTSRQQSVIKLRSGRPGELPTPIDDIEAILDNRGRAILDSVLTCAFVGSPGTLMHTLDTFIDRHRPDELIVTAQVFDYAARLRSFQILSQISRTRCI